MFFEQAAPGSVQKRSRRLRLGAINWKRVFATLSLSICAIAAIAWFGIELWRGPSAENILAKIETQPSPVLSPVEEQETFRTAPGFRVELVAAEPLVVDPIAMDWDDQGRLYVVEMRGFMRSLDAKDEDLPSGRIVVLEDLDHDGRMDTSKVFLDGLVLPRGIAVLPQGVLIGAPPNLLLCQDNNANLVCEENEKTRLTHYAEGPGNVEHAENGLLAGVDGWIYNAKSNRRFRLSADTPSPEIEIETTLNRGQWGIAQDDLGRLYYNHNSSFLFADTFPGEYTLRQPGTATLKNKEGLALNLGEDQMVWGVRTAEGLNRAHIDGTLRPDGRQKYPDAISSLAIQRGNQYGESFVGDAFIPESGGSAVAHFSINHDQMTPSAEHQLYKDPDWEKREFIASSDERFRPVDLEVGPDGALWMIDMYRGIVQHKEFMSDHLREHVKKLGLESPGETGRIWRIVKEDQPIEYRTPALSGLAQLLNALDHPNSWVRDRAQRRLIHEPSEAAIEHLRQWHQFTSRGRMHVLWSLASLQALDLPTWLTAVNDAEPDIRRIALQLGENLLHKAPDQIREQTLLALYDEDAGVRLQAIHSLGELAPEKRPVDALMSQVAKANKLEKQAILSSLAGVEMPALQLALTKIAKPEAEWISRLTTATLLAAQESMERAARSGELLDVVEKLGDSAEGKAMIQGIVNSQYIASNVRVVLDEAHALFERSADGEFGELIAQARRGFTWEGDEDPGGVMPLTNQELALMDHGKTLFAATCANCHGADGRGINGLAPPLAGASWARDADDWLVRIALHGISGPMTVLGEDWDSSMPGFVNDPRFDDEAIAGLATYVRRSWGHADPPVSSDTVARIRQESANRKKPWTADELLAMPVEHRLDRYTGTYRIPIVGLELLINRKGKRLTMGRAEGGEGPLTELSYGIFSGGGITIAFDSNDEGVTGQAKITLKGQSFNVARIKS